MASAELKLALKEAKNEIKDKDYERAMKHCKAALKIDKKNYQALVMFGRVSQELEKYEDSKKVLMMASQVDPESPIAWLGLSTLLDKKPGLATTEEAITVYIRVTGFVKEDDKLDSTYRKLASLYQEDGKISLAADALKTLAGCITNKNLITEAWRTIVQLLSQVKQLDDDDVYKLLEALENILNESVLGENESNHQLYLRTLYKTKDTKKLIDGARAMSAIFPTTYPLEWICRIYVEALYECEGDCDDVQLPISNEDAVTYIDRLIKYYNLSPWGNLAKGYLCKRSSEQRTEAKIYFRKGAERLANNLMAWLILLEDQQQHRDWSGVETSCRRIIGIIEKGNNLTIPNNENEESLKCRLKLMQAKALCSLGHVNHLKKAISILEDIPEKDVESNVFLVRAKLKLGDLNEASYNICHLESLFPDTLPVKLLRASYIRAMGDITNALILYENIVSNHPNNAESLFELGRLYFDAENYQKSLVCCLKAAKLDPNMASAFLYLGHYYQKQENTDKARKCYEKALVINPCHDEVGAALSDIYRTQGDDEANITLLIKVTDEAGRSSCGWAWLRLGLYHLSRKDYDNAVLNLQCAVEIDPSDSITYECLGDAYLARGSLSAALKMFTKASELNPAHLYFNYQIGHIKHLLGEILEAKIEYETVLAGDPPTAVRVVTLVGLAEVLITSARKNYSQFFHVNLKDDCLKAIQFLSQAASERAQSLEIWKMLGDACTLLYPLPPSIEYCSVPLRLLEPSTQDLTKMIQVDKSKILELGARCYCVGLQLDKDDASLWQDLGVNTYLQACHVKTHQTNNQREKQTKDLINRAMLAVRKSIKLMPQNGTAWNSLGIMAAHEDINDIGLAQHSFITSIHHQASVITWTHLGTLYLLQDDPHLAHEAFSQAQALDPGFVACWVGQALVAESVGHKDAFDLFRHTTLLGIQAESCLGHGHNVTEMACDAKISNNPRTQLTVNHSLPTAADCLIFYSRENENDVIGLNMNGLTLEMMGLYHSAVTSYRAAYLIITNDKQDSLPTKLCDVVRCNYGRILTVLEKLDEAMAIYGSIKEPDFFSQCGLALASIKSGRYEDAYNGYTAALHWLAPDDLQKSHVLVALACLQYKFNSMEETKTLLFKSSHLASASVEGILSLASLGLVTGDATLISAALAELSPHADSMEYVHHVAFLRAAHATVTGNIKEAKLLLSRAIHRHPSNASLWRFLSLHLISFGHQEPLRNSVSAIACAAAATTLSQADGKQKMVAQDAVAKVIGVLMKSEAHDSVDHEALCHAQRTVLMCPGSPEAWAVLIAARQHFQPSKEVGKLAKIWSKQAKEPLSAWLLNVSNQLATVSA